ncbi:MULTISPECIES: GRAM domain-containing protein [Listeria]|uniref:GRAM domain-containing protein n=1 Tax=Listeria TaxID=1637 RepID=UPI000B592C4A|nr:MULTISPECIES: GRAM domain-containing protein [Listeria]
MEQLDVVYKGLANLKMNFKAVPGKLYLTPTKLVHQPNEYFDEELVISFDDVAKIRGVKTKIFGKEVIPNIIEIQLKNGDTYQFVVNKQKKWLEAITKLFSENGQAGKLDN